MSQILKTQTEFMPENIKWLGLGNKYLENQYDAVDNWGEKGLVDKADYDKTFLTEYNFVLDNMSLR
ncbi:hypothetical protein N9998_00155 [Nitrosopumilus sp.]|nr:hypothetical protein [Nitrosopumilus sp.]|tara:strand:+ start:1246 stop:1443 length:198 start_codon:yes stop_codon:yes gene_type:complete